MIENATIAKLNISTVLISYFYELLFTIEYLVQKLTY